MDELKNPSQKDSALVLSNDSLERLPQSVGTPSYDRAALTAGIVHIGLGNFHRAHQAWYIHRLLQKGLAQDWAIIGASVRHQDQEMRQRLVDQDCLTTLIELSPNHKSAEVIGSMIDYLPISEDHSALIRQMSDAATKIVSLTITEGGYFISPTDGGLDLSHDDILKDIRTPDQPRTVFGAIVAALATRWTAGTGPMTILSCDNLRGNGGITRQAVVTLADQTDPDLAQWIDTQCSFPNSMVDCIVPATGPNERALAEEFGIKDTVPVTHENFRQWVIEDNFCAGRPPLEAVDVIITPDVHAYEAMKIRVLNAGHQVLANLGELLSVETIAECMVNPLISEFFQKVEQSEITPYVADVPGMTATEYLSLITTRFSNSEIRDTTRRVAFDGSSRHKEFILPILRDALAAGGSIQGLALVEALWARQCAGTRADGSVIQDNDPNWTMLHDAALQSEQQPEAWLTLCTIYDDLAKNAVFKEAFCRWLSLIWKDGPAKAVATYLA
ncbi:MAG: mannitol dehydrogenase family protein [Cognatishimia sp.]|uniref:mannitol dehydrogenase family protein n=1 Tax=Cognatishimia sp. TaxID=2211648 RepID=UPI003B8B7B7D